MDPATMMFLAQMAIKAGAAAQKTPENQMKQLPTKNKQQLGLLNQNVGLTKGLASEGGGYQNALSMWSEMLNPDSDIYSKLLDPYQQQFEQQTIPGLAERFAGMGAQGGALSSSGFGQALGSAGGNLQSSLAQLKAQLQQQAAGNIANQYQQLYGGSMNVDPFMYYEKQAQPGFLQKFAGGLNPSFPSFSGSGGPGAAGPAPQLSANAWFS